MSSDPFPAPDEPGPDEAGPDEPGPDEPGNAPERVRTGVDGVDEVIRAVEELDDQPIEEHVGVFEAAQSRLRQSLDDPGEPQE